MGNSVIYMPDKVVLDIQIPSIGSHYDVETTVEMKVHDFRCLLGEAIAECTEGLYCPSGQELLFSIDQNVILKEDQSLYEYQLKNGDSLFFY